MRRVILISFFALLISPMAALADTVSFNSNTSSSSSWTLSAPFLDFGLSSLLTSVQLNSGSLNTAIADGTIGWTTANGTAFGPSAVIFNPGGSVTIMGDLGDGFGVVALFTGTFQSASLSLMTGGAPGESTFSASFIAGAINPALFSILGAGPLSPNVTGTLTATLNNTFSTSAGGSGSVAGATVSLNAPTAVPEPGMLTLIGTGLLALAGLRRTKLGSQF